jgi:hypothetical protein
VVLVRGILELLPAHITHRNTFINQPANAIIAIIFKGIDEDPMDHEDFIRAIICDEFFFRDIINEDRRR